VRVKVGQREGREGEKRRRPRERDDEEGEVRKKK